MTKFVVYSGIPSAEMDVMTCVEGLPKVLKAAGVDDIQVTSCYCCSPPAKGEVIVEVEAPNKEYLTKKLEQLGFLVQSINEVIRIHPKEGSKEM